MRKSVWLAWICRNTKQVPRLKCVWIPLNSLQDNQEQLIKLWSHIIFTVMKLYWLCWLCLQMYASVNERRFWHRAFCSLWLGKITRELLEMEAWGALPSLYPSLCKCCKGNKNSEIYRRNYKSYRAQENTYFSPVLFSCITYQEKGLERKATVAEIFKTASWKTQVNY